MTRAIHRHIRNIPFKTRIGIPRQATILTDFVPEGCQGIATDEGGSLADWIGPSPRIVWTADRPM